MSQSNILLLPAMLDIWQQTLNWQPDEKQQQLFQHLYELILTGNSHLNLTRITEPIEFWEKHLWDSLRGISPFLPTQTSDRKIIDIGTGAGFPGIPVAIAQPNNTVTLLDSTGKKISFLQNILGELDIKNAVTLLSRAEEAGRQKQHRQTYDIALVRAVAPASVCAEYALPLLKVDGLAIIYRGQWTEAETNDFKLAVETLGGAIDSIESFTTPLSNSIRHCLYLRKIAPTPAKFPRAIGIPTQKPL